MMVRAYSIRDLETITGVPRTTIHFYLRQGLLPHAQKTAASRSLYTDEHVTILGRIAELKGQGKTLAEIESELRPRLDEANEAAVDLAAQEWQRLHDRILAVATREFIASGYKNTHVTAIMRELGVTATLFYSHFPSKRRLLAECVAGQVGRSTVYVDSKEKETGSPGERLLWDVFGNSQAFELVASALAVLRVEGAEDDADLERLLQEALATEVNRLRRILDAQQGEHPRPSQFSGELVALGLFASHQPLALPPLYEAHSRRDLLEARLWLFLAAQAARNGEVDIDSRLAGFADLLDTLASETPPLPPGLADPPLK
jgi:DNA-binding transcriptional MerR regulator